MIKGTCHQIWVISHIHPLTELVPLDLYCLNFSIGSHLLWLDIKRYIYISIILYKFFKHHKISLEGSLSFREIKIKCWIVTMFFLDACNLLPCFVFSGYPFNPKTSLWNHVIITISIYVEIKKVMIQLG